MERCPYCESTQFIRKGFSALVVAYQGRRRQRFLCKGCKRYFSEHVHTIFYQLKKNDPALNAKIFYLIVHYGASIRSIARQLFISEHCVRIRLSRMARRAFSFHEESLRDFKIEEKIAFDGLENFAGSQYDPNNIQQAIGADSLFIYDFNFASLNRKGRISEWQRRRLVEIENNFGRYNPRSIRLATKDILERLHSKKHPAIQLTLLSDEHFQYRRVIKGELKSLQIEHVTISSKASRNFQNILFAVNHADLCIRQQIGAFSRETISFSKTAGIMCQKYMLFMICKNFMLPQFTKKHVRRPFAHLKSPAEHLGLTSKLLSFTDIFDRRARVEDRLRLNDDWQHFWQAEIPEKHRRAPQFVRKSKTA